MPWIKARFKIRKKDVERTSKISLTLPKQLTTFEHEQHIFPLI